MILIKYFSQFCLRGFPTTFKAQNKTNFSIFILKIWLFKYILLTNCCVHGLIDESSNESLPSPDGPSPKNFVEASYPLKHWTITPICIAHLHDNSLNFQYVTQVAQDQPIFMRIFKIINYIREENDDAALIRFPDNSNNTNSTKAAEASNTKKTSRNARKSENMRQYKNILDLIELFLCLLIAICFELIPLIWQQFQRQQRTFASLQAIQAQQQQRARQTQLTRVRSTSNRAERNFLVKLGQLGWLLASRKSCFRTNMQFKETKPASFANTLLAIKLPQQKEHIKSYSSNDREQRTIVFTIVLVRTTGRVSWIKLKTTELNALYNIRPISSIPCVEEHCNKRTNSDKIQDTINTANTAQKPKIRPIILASRQKEKLKILSNNVTPQQNACYEKKRCSCSYYCSLCYCCCCCCCLQCDCDCECYCYRCWPCCVCGYFCSLCFCKHCAPNVSLSCCKNSSNSYYHMPNMNMNVNAKNFCDKYATQKPHEYSKQPNNAMNILKNLCQDACECVLKYTLGLCCKKKPLYHQQQRRLQQQCRSQHSPSKKNNFNNGHHAMDNCTSNYQKLKANNVCKFFCNNRKRQRRRRRKRRRHHTLNIQDCQSSNRFNVAIVNSQPIRRFERVQVRCLSSMFGSLITSFQNALKTIIKFQKLQNNQQISKVNLKQTTKQLDCDSQFLIKIVRNPISSQHQNFKRIYCRGLRSRPNLVWLFIGLVWFESSRLVDCYLYRQKLSESSASPLLLPASTSPATFPEQLQMLARGRNHALKRCFLTEQYGNTKYETQQRTKVQSTGVFLQKIPNGIVPEIHRIPHLHDSKSVNQRNRPEYSMPNDQVRLESIKSQILSKLGLAGRPNVSHPLPKEFIWDTIYRVDELGTMIKNFDFADMETQGSSSTWSLMDNYGREHTVQVRVQSNSTHAPHQSYKYSEQQLNSVSQPNFKNTRDNLKNLRNRKNNYNKNKLTYLSGITSGMEVPINLHSDPIYARGSPGHETEKFGLNSNTNAIVADIYRTQMNAKRQEDGYLNDRDIDEYFGNTEEIIAFAEEGQLYSQHRLVEFSTKAKDLIRGKLFVRKAEIHLKIDQNKTKKHKTVEGNGKLKIWIFRMIETNVTTGVPDQKIHFCAAFDIDKRFLGWKKLDITETVQNWLTTRRIEKVTEKLSLLIDCTGCGDQYRLHLFEAEKQKNSNFEDTPNETVFQGSANVLRNDVVAIWLQQQVEKNSSFSRDQRKIGKPQQLQNQQVQKQNLYRPFLMIRAEVHRSRRVRRRVVDCSGALRGQCCKESFYVSFKALGWDDWIIAPRGYFANYCRGECTGPYRTPDTFQTFHAHFIEEYRKMGLLNGMKPCCAPIKFSSMSLIYYGDDGIIKRDLPKMVVDECGCP